jgi:hypothetical protein
VLLHSPGSPEPVRKGRNVRSCRSPKTQAPPGFGIHLAEGLFFEGRVCDGLEGLCEGLPARRTVMKRPSPPLGRPRGNSRAPVCGRAAIVDYRARAAVALTVPPVPGLARPSTAGGGGAFPRHALYTRARVRQGPSDYARTQAGDPPFQPQLKEVALSSALHTRAGVGQSGRVCSPWWNEVPDLGVCGLG